MLMRGVAKVHSKTREVEMMKTCQGIPSTVNRVSSIVQDLVIQEPREKMSFVKVYGAVEAQQQ